MTKVDLRRLALDGLIDEVGSMYLGLYPEQVMDATGGYPERTEWMNGWNAAVIRQNQHVLQIYAWFNTVPPEYLTQVEDLLLEGILELSVEDDTRVFQDGPIPSVYSIFQGTMDVRLVYMCNDIFYWGCADCEDVSFEDLKDLTACIEECPKWGGELWVARKRKERPQNALLECMSPEDQRLFNVCGPVKPVGLGNPREHPDNL